MANLNRIILVGRLTADPEGRSTLDGFAMTKFRLAVSRQGGLDRAANFASGTDFVDIITWRNLAEACANHLKKGHLVLVEGRLQIRSFEDQTGGRRWATEVVAKDVRGLESSRAVAQAAPEEEVVEDTDLASDLPF